MKKNYIPSVGEINTEPSKTIPGQSIPIRTMIEKQRQGMIILGNGLDYTDDEEPLPTAKDLTDLDDAAAHLENFKRKVLKLKKDRESRQATESASGGD